MTRPRRAIRPHAPTLLFLLLFSMGHEAQASWRFGPSLRSGLRYDNVRMCVATDPGVNGGPAMDVSLKAELKMNPTMQLTFDLPVMRPILFGAAFSMLQFEPSVALTYTLLQGPTYSLDAGPMAGLSLHFGPDEDSESSGDARGDSFFAAGPMVGGYAGMTFRRPGKPFAVKVGLTLYGTPLFTFSDEEKGGYVLGGSLDITLLWR